MSIALYRKYRPKDFEDIVGQSHITNVLKNQIRLGKISHAYIFSGVRGTGKTSTAKVFAKAVSCENYDQDKGPCNNCLSCKNNAIDTVEIDAASNNSVDNIRDLQETVMYLPSYAKYKVYIIDEVHMLSQGAFNALLKTLEEPPPHVIFILATTEIGKIPETVLSRCQKFDFRKIDEKDIFDRLKYILEKETIDYDEDALKYICKLSKGGLRDAISIVDQVSSLGKVDIENTAFAVGEIPLVTVDKIIESLLAKDTLGCLEILQEQKRQVDIKTVPNLIMGRLIDALHIKAKSSKEVLYKKSLSKLSEQIGIGEASDLIVELSQLSADMRYSQNPEILLDAFMVSTSKDIKVDTNGQDDQINKIKSQIQDLKDEIKILKTHGVKLTKELADSPHMIDGGNINTTTKATINDKKKDDSKPSTNLHQVKTLELTQAEKDEIQNVQDCLLDVHAKLRQDKNLNVSALLVEGKVARVANDTIYLSYDEKMTFHKKKIEAQGNILILKEAIEKITGQNYDIKVVFDKELSEKVQEPKDENLEKLKEKFEGVPIDVVGD